MVIIVSFAQLIQLLNFAGSLNNNLREGFTASNNISEILAPTGKRGNSKAQGSTFEGKTFDKMYYDELAPTDISHQ